MSFRTVIISKQSKISYKNRFLVVKQDADEKYIHLSEIDTIIVDSIAVSISSYLLKELSDNKINVTHITSKNEEYKGNVFVLTSELAKGLEFDAVIINDASNKKYSVNSRLDMNLLYVSSTRAIHELEVLYDKNICEIFKENVKNKDTQKVKQLIKR